MSLRSNRASGTSVRAQANVFGRSPEARKRLPIQIFVLRNLVSPITEGISPILSTIFNIDLPYIRLIYERLGIFVFTVINPASSVDDRKKGGLDDTVVLIDPPPGFSLFTGLTEDQARILATNNLGLSSSGVPARVADTIRIFYVGLLNPLADNGVYYSEDPPGVLDGAVFVANVSPLGAPAVKTSAAAHEMGHALIIPHTDHYSLPSPPLRFRLNQNLMVPIANPATFFTIGYAGRLWHIPGAGKGSQNQYDTIRSSKFIRSF